MAREFSANSDDDNDSIIELSDDDGGEATISELSTLSELVNNYTMQLVSLKAPDWYINPIFTTVLDAEVDQIFADTPLTFAPGLSEPFQSDTALA